MSHFMTLVLVDGRTTPGRENIELAVEQLLAPYSENLEVAEYMRDCYCIGSAARKTASEEMQKRLGSWDDARAVHTAAHPDENIDQSQESWEEEYYRPRNKVEQEIFEAHPDKAKPDPDCTECKGTGKEPSTYNPKSQWDWFVIGGRWTGELSGYEPTQDPKNKRTCTFCGGTGKRTDMEVANGCNCCGGTGIETLWPTEWGSHDGDIMPLSAFDLRKMADEHAPYALVTPDGEWHQRGKMGWWGMSHNEIDKGEWKDQVFALLSQHPTAVAVVVDCHI